MYGLVWLYPQNPARTAFPAVWLTKKVRKLHAFAGAGSISWVSGLSLDHYSFLDTTVSICTCDELTLASSQTPTQLLCYYSCSIGHAEKIG